MTRKQNWTMARFPEDKRKHTLICPAPECGCGQTHLRSIRYYSRPTPPFEDTQTVLVTVERGSIEQEVVPDDQNPSLRRDAVALHFACEWGHTFDLIFSQHKGDTYTYVANVQREVGYDEPVD